MEAKMKITRRQLRKLISESIYGTGKRGYAKTRPEDPMMHVSPDIRKKLEPLITNDDPAFQRQGYDLATTLQPDSTVFPFEGDPYTRKPYEGYDYIEDLMRSKGIYGDFLRIHKNLKNAYDAAEGKVITVKLRDDLLDAFNEAFDYAKKLAKVLGKPDDEASSLYNKLFKSALPED